MAVRFAVHFVAVRVAALLVAQLAPKLEFLQAFRLNTDTTVRTTSIEGDRVSTSDQGERNTNQAKRWKQGRFPGPSDEESSVETEER